MTLNIVMFQKVEEKKKMGSVVKFHGLKLEPSIRSPLSQKNGSTKIQICYVTLPLQVLAAAGEDEARASAM